MSSQWAVSSKSSPFALFCIIIIIIIILDETPILSVDTCMSEIDDGWDHISHEGVQML